MTIRTMTANARSGLPRALDRASFPHVGECTGAPGAMRPTGRPEGESRSAQRAGRPLPSLRYRGADQRNDDGRVSAAGEAMR